MSRPFLFCEQVRLSLNIGKKSPQCVVRGGWPLNICTVVGGSRKARGGPRIRTIQLSDWMSLFLSAGLYVSSNLRKMAPTRPVSQVRAGRVCLLSSCSRQQSTHAAEAAEAMGRFSTACPNAELMRYWAGKQVAEVSDVFLLQHGRPIRFSPVSERSNLYTVPNVESSEELGRGLLSAGCQ